MESCTHYAPLPIRQSSVSMAHFAATRKRVKVLEPPRNPLHASETHPMDVHCDVFDEC